ncbi:MAG: hypothetical protein PHX74_05395 [Candidatus Sumerlaeales bacterium]|nr:hypothetical protein [Candidatus Sumerlaeales bacterium]
MSNTMLAKLQRLVVMGMLFSTVTIFSADAFGESNPLPNYGFGMMSSNVPKFNYTQQGNVVMEKRYDANLTADFLGMRKKPFKANVRGLKPQAKCDVMFRTANHIFTDQQKEILQEWGQPDYVRGPYRSSRGDQVNEWAYLQANHIFQFVSGEMVFEGPLTDQDRCLITFGAPNEHTVTQAEPGVRQELWIYRPWYSTKFNERIFKFSNGKMIFRQEAP